MTNALDGVLLEGARAGYLRYVPNFGNAGDALIALGAMRRFERLGINYRFCRQIDPGAPNTIVFAGGGALVGLYKRSEHAFLQAVHSGANVVVLPHTITRLTSEMISKPEKLTIFCRELRTYEYVKGLANLKNVGLEHDMAFSLLGEAEGISRLPIFPLFVKALGQGSVKDRLRVIKNWPRARRAFAGCEKIALKKRTLSCYRTDVEGTGRNFSGSNIDVSHEFSLGTETPASVWLSGVFLLKAISLFEELETDRLHCCIGGALLSKTVKFGANSYFKNRAVYEYSIMGRGYRVEWNEC